MVGQCLFGELIESARLHIGLDLAIPRCRVELRIPAAKLVELFVGERGDFAFELLDLGHAFIIQPNTTKPVVRLTSDYTVNLYCGDARNTGNEEPDSRISATNLGTKRCAEHDLLTAPQ